MEIKIRKATCQDCNALCEIHVSAIRELGKSHYSEAEVDAWSRGRIPERYEKHIRDRQVVIAQHRSIPVGFGTVDLSTGEVRQLYVRAEYARKHIGTQILEELLEIARAAGLREVHCISSLNAEAFYGNAGFQSGQKCKHRFRDGGEIDCIAMKKLLE
jgi:N-acetylglutamate synthase-like GNAT family acetyltransferase